MKTTAERKLLKFIIKETAKGCLRDAGRFLWKKFKEELAKEAKKAAQV